jgi:hypothetical protein
MWSEEKQKGITMGKLTVAAIAVANSDLVAQSMYCDSKLGSNGLKYIP